MNEPVKIICPYCYSPDLSMYLEGLNSGTAGAMSIPAGNVGNNNMEMKCNACGHVFKPADGKLSQEAMTQQGFKPPPPAAVAGMKPDEAQILILVNTRGKLAAVKYCCDTYGWGLKESKDYVDGLMGDTASGVAAPEASRTFDPEHAIALLQSHGKISAIKYIKDGTGMGLRESKDYVEMLAKQRNIAVRKEGCFIATACYGDYEAAEVRLLRGYRDEVLAASAAGRAFIRLYYRLSPRPASWLERHPQWQRIIRTCLLQPLLYAIRP